MAIDFSSSLKNYFQEISTIDIRALIAFRISLGLCALLTLLNLSFHTHVFYTDTGATPRQVLIQFMTPWNFSFHLINGSHAFQIFLFMIGMTLSFLFIIGWKTRLTNFFLWLFIVSLHNYNFLVLHSGDNLMRIMLFWSLFLPATRGWETNQKDRLKSEFIWGLAPLCLLVQLLYMYFFTALLKDHPIWHTDFTAVYYALNVDIFTSSIGTYLRQFPQLLKAMTASTYYLEFFGPLLFFLPFVQRHLRMLLPLAFIGFHIGLFITMDLGLFPWTCIACWLLFLPNKMWDILSKPLERLRCVYCYLLKVHSKLPNFDSKIDVLHNLNERFAIKHFVLVFLFSCITMWNIYSLPAVAKKAPELTRRLTLTLRLDQYWSMFSPYPLIGDGWVVVDGALQDGTQVEPLRIVTKPQWQKPQSVSNYYSTTPWRKYLSNLWVEKTKDEYRLFFGKYLCRRWNFFNGRRPAGKSLKSFKLYFMRESTPAPGEAFRIEKDLRWEHNCFKEET